MLQLPCDLGFAEKPLSGRAIGPRVLASADGTVVLRMPGKLVAPAFRTDRGASFLAVGAAVGGRPAPASYTLVDDLIESEPLVVQPDTGIGELARRMTENGWGAAAVQLPDGYGLVSDSLLRERVLAVDGDQPRTAGEVMRTDPPTVVAGSSAAEALILLLDNKAPAVLVTERSGELRGMVGPATPVVDGVPCGVFSWQPPVALVEELSAILDGRPA